MENLRLVWVTQQNYISGKRRVGLGENDKSDGSAIRGLTVLGEDWTSIPSIQMAHDPL